MACHTRVNVYGVIWGEKRTPKIWKVGYQNPRVKVSVEEAFSGLFKQCFRQTLKANALVRVVDLWELFRCNCSRKA
jgi:hypothetical protein